MKRLIALVLAVVVVCMCVVPVFAASGVKIVNSKYANDINSGETFKYKATFGLTKPKLTIKDDHGVLEGREKTIRIKIVNASSGKAVSNKTYNLTTWKPQVTITLPNKKETYKVQVTVEKNNAPWMGTPSFTATVSRGKLSK